MLLAALTLPSSGCLAAAITAGAVGAGAAGYAYYQGAVPRDYNAGMDQTWNATQAALADLSMPVISAERGDTGATIESRTGDGSKIAISLEPRAARVPADGTWTHVSIRVAMLGDKPTSERIMNQIDARLAPPLPPGQQVPVISTQSPQPGQQVPVTTAPATQPVMQTSAPPLAQK
jgi:hypothetical protein